VGKAYPTLVPQVDANGNDLGGVALPEIAVPLATYTGWNLRSESIGAPTERTAFLGSFVPLHATSAGAAAAHDPRPAVEARYANYEAYRDQFQKALDGLVAGRYVLAEDAGQLMDRSKVEWDWVMQQP
jgi:hypothetical protein